MPGGPAIKVQTPEALAPTKWQVRLRHRCDVVNCNFRAVEIPEVVSFNPVMLTPRPGELADALRDSLRERYATPHPCRSCRRDAAVSSIGEEDPPPMFIVCHVRRGHGPVGGQWAQTRMNVTERVEVRGEQYRLHSIV